MVNLFHKIVLRGNVDKRLVWVTDLHLDAAESDTRQKFYQEILSFNPSGLLLGGDICNGPESFAYLEKLRDLLQKPIYFVLGNHDFYLSSIDKTRKRARDYILKHPDVHYLTTGELIPLSAETVLLGHDGWSDARAGDFLHSNVVINDYLYIEDLKFLSPHQRMDKLNQLGDESVLALQKGLTDAFRSYQQVLMLIHPPPFEEACCYGGKQCDANWAPHFVAKAVGGMLEKIMNENPTKALTVLCGHAHYGVDLQVLPNLRVLTGHSDIGTPTVQGMISFS